MEKWQYVGMIGRPRNREKVYIQNYFMQIGNAKNSHAFSTVAIDFSDYRYTHGGRLYREACEMVWQFRNQNSEIK